MFLLATKCVCAHDVIVCFALKGSVMQSERQHHTSFGPVSIVSVQHMWAEPLDMGVSLHHPQLGRQVRGRGWGGGL